MKSLEEKLEEVHCLTERQNVITGDPNDLKYTCRSVPLTEPEILLKEVGKSH